MKYEEIIRFIRKSNIERILVFGPLSDWDRGYYSELQSKIK